MRSAVGLLLLFLAACGSPGSAPVHDRAAAPPPASQAPDAPDPSAQTPASQPAASCDPAETARLQTVLDRAHGAKSNAVVAVKTACGTRFFSSGPSKVGAKTLHRIGSVTKTYTAGVILTLAREGALSIDDKVSRWVAGVPSGDVITLRDLLRHTSGLFDYTTDTEFFQAATATRKWMPAELLAYSTRHALVFTPGSKHEYSNTNFVLLGMIAELAGKADIVSLYQSLIFVPNGLKETFLGNQGDDETTGADPSWAWTAGAMLATPEDVLRWIELVGSGAFYDPATEKQLLTPFPSGQDGMTVGLGIFLYDASITGGGGLAIDHGGYYPPYQTDAAYFPEKHASIVSILDTDYPTESMDMLMAAVWPAVFAGP